ncbi:hypothetical protein SOV_09010 [Sporomusa ovata DSM 2662]|uniref:Glucosamine inositolphosphorylceramide transferase 1 N-terminal domain-containing protein n=1 Tax=Sporomusa ovata TaxID=2378 RepID=A0A0U1L5E7_9FIRM|nr:hypothetical protein SOV_1c02390 [Sporomusa ovata DSM 2662]CQR74880.1 hypothetical protein SpAn4DRAFT_4237 [Sporomusa ovata]
MTSLEKLFIFKQWFIAFRKKQSFSVPLAMDGFQIIPPPAGRFFADPFVIENERKNYIFFEDYRLRTRKGVISCIEIDEQGNCTEPQTILEKEYHLAYPFLLKTEQGIFMIPDTSANNTIELYEAVKFPDQWVLKRVLMSGFKASDSTIYPYNGKVWLFTNAMNSCEPAGKGELCVFYADSLFGEWKPHRCNPVNQDPRTARPAGNIFLHDGKIIRPSQNCSLEYGASVMVNEITRLTETEYVEQQLFEIGPEWYQNNRRLHTYNSNNHWEVIDGLIDIVDVFKPVRWLSSYWFRCYK